jgi:hypothetical protein
VDSCGAQGIASHILVKAQYYNISLELGFELHIQSLMRDFVQEHTRGLYLHPVFPGTLFFPERCDVVIGGSHEHLFSCL